MAELPYEVEQVLVGSLMGDGGLTKTKSVRYYEVHSIKQLEYLKWKAEILLSFFEGKMMVRKVEDGRQFPILSTHSHPILTNLRKFWYLNGRKNISLQALEMLDKLGLAVWYQDDGYYNYEKQMCGLALGKKFLDRELAVKDWFLERWSLNSYIATKIKNPCIHFSAKNSDEFLHLIAEYIQPCMIYKLGRLHPVNRAKIEDKYRQSLLQHRKRDIRYYYRNREARLRYKRRDYLAKTLDQDHSGKSGR